jgi:CubicO group peptidase (beta-lactamase class C family)
VTEGSGLLEALRELVPRALDACGTVGLNVAVARRGEVVLEEGFGLADLASGRPMEPSTVSRAGSMSKLYTAVAVLQLVEEGLLGLDEPVTRYVDLPVENPLGSRPVTVRDLMHHRAGLTSDAAGCSHGPSVGLAEFLRDSYMSEFLDEYEGSTVPVWSAPVGERFQYSNIGISTLGYLVEAANRDGFSCAEHIRSRILEPLGMTSSAFPAPEDHVDAALIERLSAGYAGYGGLAVATPPIRIAAYPAGALLTTPGDHVKLILALLAGGTYGGATLLRPESVEEMLRPEVDSGGGVWTGLVARIERPGALDESFGHWGAIMWGWYNCSAGFPNLDLAVTVCTNTWPMITYLDESAPTAMALVLDFVAEWYAREHAGLPNEPRSWAWKTSYAVGLSMAERTKGMLGIDDALPEEALAVVAGGTPEQAAWDEQGFRAGVSDMLGVRQTPPTVAAFLASPEVRVARTELRLIHAELGGRGPFELPPEIGSWLTTGPDRAPDAPRDGG